MPDVKIAYIAGKNRIIQNDNGKITLDCTDIDQYPKSIRGEIMDEINRA